MSTLRVQLKLIYRSIYESTYWGTHGIYKEYTQTKGVNYLNLFSRHLGFLFSSSLAFRALIKKIFPYSRQKETKKCKRNRTTLKESRNRDENAWFSAMLNKTRIKGVEEREDKENEKDGDIIMEGDS